jgi:hypothetical protein
MHRTLGRSAKPEMRVRRSSGERSPATADTARQLPDELLDKSGFQIVRAAVVGIALTDEQSLRLPAVENPDKLATVGA